MADNLRVNYGTEVSADEVYTSGVAAVDYLKSHFNVNRVMVIGEEAIKNQVEAARVHACFWKNPEVVLQSLDRNVTYKDLETATLAIVMVSVYRNEYRFQLHQAKKAQSQDQVLSLGFLKVATQVEPIIIGKTK